MTGFPPKASRGGAKKSNNIGSPIVIKSFSTNTTSEEHSSIEMFINSTSAEEQLGILKSIIEEQKDSIDDRIIQFLATVFYEAPAKHPLKCFLSRHVTKCTAIQKTFTDVLTGHIVSEIKGDINYHKYEYYAEKVPKVMLCIENFPCGALAIEGVGVNLLTRNLFFNYFFLCRKELRNSTLLSPTKKNEMFTLEHVMLRLIVHAIQKLDIDESEHNANMEASTQSVDFDSIMYCVHTLISDEEVPMDTKSLSGILILSAENLRLGSGDAWKLVLETCVDYSKVTDASETNVYDRVLRHRLGRLAVYSAIASTVSMSLLQVATCSTGSQTPAVLMLIEQLLTYADGSSSEPAETVVVSRALLQLSRSLGSLGGARSCEVGGRAVAALLPFVWTHLEFHLDSVRHLANHLLAACLDYCAELETRDETAPLESVLRSVRSLGEARSFYWAVSRAVPALGAARVSRDLCDAPALLRAAATPHLQAAASTAISALLSGGACAGLETSEVFDRWVRPALGSPAALQAVLPSAISAHPALLDYIGSHVHGRAALACVRAAPACRACVTPRALRAAAIHKDDESRILALSLVAECGRTTAGVTRAELDSVLWFLRYNLGAPRPGFRTALLANINKVLKRLEDSHRPMSRRGESTEHYGAFIEQVRALCFAAALRGASHGRRSAALQLLAGTHSVLATVPRVWKAEHVLTLVQHLDDSYDTNKATALQVLQHCPLQLLEDCTREVTLEAVLRGAVSPRAAGGSTAAARLRLLLARLPHRIALPLDAHLVREEALRPHYALLRSLLQQLRDVADADTWREAARGGAPGTLRCVADVLRRDDVTAADWRRPPWSELATELETECLSACARAEPVVTHHAPEGYLPAFPGSAIESEEGRPVTAQMVLVCAWRTVKEASAVLGLLAPRGDAARSRAGEYLVGLLTRAMHRGAVEQAAVGLAAVAHACWSDEQRAHWPRQWTRELVALAERDAAHATRRGAGLPAAIQALVSSEVSATGRAECFHECMAELLRLASTDAPADAPGHAPGHAPADAVARRTLAANILRALFRHAALEKESQKHVGAGLRLALQGFEAAAWPERTAMSLLYCAVSVRVFGVTRARGAELHARNTLPAALFFQRYPGIYDLMLSKLEEFEPGSAAGPGVLPVLLLLARLYPSAVEGAASSLKVSAFVGLVQRCACAAELRVRRAAAGALPALLSHTEHLPYIERLLVAISRPHLLHNHWHGALLTLASLLKRASPAGAPATPAGPRVRASVNALAQAAGPRPCYPVAREYVNVLNLLIWKFPEMVPREVLASISKHLDDILFSEGPPGPDRALCLADCTLLYFIVLHKQKQVDRILPLINRTLGHTTYEVVLATLDYLLIQRDAPTDDTCNLRRHTLAIRDVTTLQKLKETSDYTTTVTKLNDFLHDVNKYQECRVKCLKLLSIEDNTQMLIVNEVFPSYCDNRNKWIAKKLINRIEESHENTKHMFLESLLKLTKENYGELMQDSLLDIYRVMYDCSSSDNSVDSRMAVVEYYETYFEREMAPSSKFNPGQLFLYDALVLSTLVTLLEDDDDVIRERAADVIARMPSPCTLPDDVDEAPADVCVEDEASLRCVSRATRDAAGGVMASAAGEVLRSVAAHRLGAPALLLLALLDFHSEVCLTDQITDECRVFDQSERYNIFLEESVWTASCADRIVLMYKYQHTDLIEYALSIIRDQHYSIAFQTLCRNNVKLFEKMAKGDFVADETVNPKIEILVRKLRGS